MTTKYTNKNEQEKFQTSSSLLHQIEEKELNLQAIAHEMKFAQDHCRKITPFTSLINEFGIAEAYAVANLIHKLRVKEGSFPVGRKIGFTNPKMWSTFKVYEPIWAYVYNESVVHLSKQNTYCYAGDFSEPKIEPEIVLHFFSNPPKDACPEEILSCIDWIAHGIEIVQCHFPNWEFKTADTIVDSGLHAKLFVGEPQKLNNSVQELISKLESFSISLSCDGILEEQGSGSNVLGSPLKAVSHLIKVISDYSGNRPLESGELVTTGTLTKAFPIKAGQKWVTKLEGINIPGISIQF